MHLDRLQVTTKSTCRPIERRDRSTAGAQPMPQQIRHRCNALPTKSIDPGDQEDEALSTRRAAGVSEEKFHLMQLAFQLALTASEATDRRRSSHGEGAPLQARPHCQLPEVGWSDGCRITVCDKLLQPVCLCCRFCLQVCNAILALAGLGMLGECFAEWHI